MEKQKVTEAVEKLINSVGIDELKKEVQCLTVGYVAQNNAHLTGSECANTVFISMALLEFCNDLEHIKRSQHDNFVSSI